MAVRKKDRAGKYFACGASAEYLGVVSAPDEDAALMRAIEAFAITAAHQQKSLMVRRLVACQ